MVVPRNQSGLVITDKADERAAVDGRLQRDHVARGGVHPQLTASLTLALQGEPLAPLGLVHMYTYTLHYTHAIYLCMHAWPLELKHVHTVLYSYMYKYNLFMYGQYIMYYNTYFYLYYWREARVTTVHVHTCTYMYGTCMHV